MAKQKQTNKQIPTGKGNPIISTGGNERIYLLIIFFFSFAIYFNSIFNEYNLDDELVTRNHRLTSKGISAIPEIFSSPYYEDQIGYKYEYRPVVLVSFAIEHSLFGDNAHISHFINVLLYGYLCTLLFWVLRKLLKEYNALFPFIISIIFAAHPIHTEVVASIKNRDEILALGFGLLSLLFAIDFVRQKQIFQLILIPVFFFIGILSKSTTITFALLIPLSLVMFISVNLRYLLLITLTLLVPTVFYSRLYSVSQQIILALALIIFAVALHYLKNSKNLLDQVRKFLLGKYRLIITQTESQIAISPSLDFSFLKNKLIFFSVVSVILVTGAISASGIYMGKMWLSVIPLLIFALLFIYVRDELKVLFITPFSLIALFAIIKFHRPSSLIEVSLIFFLANQILSGNKYFRAIGIFNYLIYAFVTGLLLGSQFFVIMLFFIGFFNKKLFPVTILIVFISVIVFCVRLYRLYIGEKEFDLAYFSIPVVYAGFIFLWRQRQHLLYKMGIICVPLMVLLYFLTTSPRGINNEIRESIQISYYKVAAIKAPEATPVQALRPVKYIENPIQKTDAFHVKLGTAMIILGKYLKSVFVPYPMSFYYGYAYIVPTSLWQFGTIVILLIHFMLFAAAIFFINRLPLFSFSVLFYLISISVFSNLLLPVPGMMGDRFLFTASIGFSTFLAWFLGTIFKQNFIDSKLRLSSLRLPVQMALIVILSVYSILTFSRNLDWKNHITLFRHDIKAVENSAQAQNLLGVHLSMLSGSEADAIKQKQMSEEAIVHFKKAIEIYPQFLNATFDLGRTYESMGRFDDAYKAYRHAFAIDSGFLAPCRFLGLYNDSKENLDSAIYFYKKFLTAYPYESDINANLSYAYYKLGKYDSSIAVNRRELILSPNTFNPTINIAKTFLQMNMKDSAIIYFERAQRINPSDPNVAKTLDELQKRQ